MLKVEPRFEAIVKVFIERYTVISAHQTGMGKMILKRYNHIVVSYNII